MLGDKAPLLPSSKLSFIHWEKKKKKQTWEEACQQTRCHHQ